MDRAIRRFAASLAAASSLASLALGAATAFAGQATFTTPGTEGTFTVPSGVTKLHVVAVGGKGGSGYAYSGSQAGVGAYGAVASADLPVSGGQVLYVEIGGNGPDAYGYPDASNGGGHSTQSGGGGGASDVRTTPYSGANSDATRLLVAGGGGGGGSALATTGGNGGAAGAAGADCTAGALTATGGQPGTTSGPGAGGVYGGVDGAGKAGGDGGYGGAGGGGLYGGGGGGYQSSTSPQQTCGAGGGGGSSGFAAGATNTSIGLDTTGVPSVALSWADPYPRPKGATPVRVSLVPAFQSCSAPNDTHGAPLSSGSCAPPVQASAQLTIGTPDANGASAKGIGYVVYTVLTGDVRVTAAITDVRLTSTLADYAGELQVNSAARITDKLSGTWQNESATGDTDFPITVPCATNSDATVGSTCSVTTTFNAVTPGALVAGARSIWQLGDVKVLDGGADGLASTAPNTLFERQGVFIP
jgi:Glycine rich protein